MRGGGAGCMTGWIAGGGGIARGCASVHRLLALLCRNADSVTECLNFRHILAVYVQQDAPSYARGRVYYSVQGVGMGHPGGLRMYICPMTAGGIFQPVNHL